MTNYAPLQLPDSVLSGRPIHFEPGPDTTTSATEQTNGLLNHYEQQEEPQSTKDSTAETIRIASTSPSTEDEKRKVPSRKLKHFPYILWLAVGYSILAVFAWAIICILVYRPITTRHYGLWLDEDDVYGDSYPAPSAYTQNERWFQAARVIQAIVAVVTIPLTSAVCSNAAVVFIQRKSKGNHLSLRQTIALADKGWARYDVYAHLLRGNWRQYGSTLLYLALALNFLGGTIAPLQSVFATTTTIQTPRYPGRVQRLTDILDQFRIGSNLVQGTAPYDAANLRYVLTSTAATDPQSRLWSASGALNCTNSTYENSAACALGQVSLGNVSELEDPFFAELPAGYSTGLIRQFIPRINSSATRVRISEADFPSNCNNPSSFYVSYSSATNTSFVNGTAASIASSLIACMPGDQTISPWISTRKRQDFTEELYLNLSTREPGAYSSIVLSGFYKITMNTTAGYFELPNFMNAQRPGALLSDDPGKYCGRDCILQDGAWHLTPVFDHNNSPETLRRRQAPDQDNASTTVTDAANALEGVKNKGPLLTIAMALFGAGSFVEDRLAHPKAYINKDVVDLYVCTERAPFVGLLYSSDADGVGVMSCVSSEDYNYPWMEHEILSYVNMFIELSGLEGYDERIQNAFQGAAFLANELWLTSAAEYSATLTVSYDPGAGTQVPVISLPGIALISLLLGVYLTSLLSMAIYSKLDPKWTGQLDAFAMMRLGAAIADDLPLSVAFSPERIKVLDETPGWIGDATDGGSGVGELALGAPTPLSAKRRYRCYEQERDQDDEKERGKKSSSTV